MAFCEHCGKVVSYSAKFCRSCGGSLLPESQQPLLDVASVDAVLTATPVVSASASASDPTPSAPSLLTGEAGVVVRSVSEAVADARRTGISQPHPQHENVVITSEGKVSPATGYQWADATQGNYCVIPVGGTQYGVSRSVSEVVADARRTGISQPHPQHENVVITREGKVSPATGYQWADATQGNYCVIPVRGTQYGEAGTAHPFRDGQTIKVYFVDDDPRKGLIIPHSLCSVTQLSVMDNFAKENFRKMKEKADEQSKNCCCCFLFFLIAFAVIIIIMIDASDSGDSDDYNNYNNDDYNSRSLYTQQENDTRALVGIPIILIGAASRSARNNTRMSDSTNAVWKGCCTAMNSIPMGVKGEYVAPVVGGCCSSGEKGYILLTFGAESLV